MSRGAKIALGVLVVLAVLLALNALALDNETKPAVQRVDGAEIVRLPGGNLQVLDVPARRAGPGGDAPIVLLHCFTCAIDWWDRMIPALSRRHRVIAIDLLGHGGSEKPKSGYEITEQAALVAQVLAERDVEGATVVGHSLGGSVATAVAEQSRELVDRLVIVDQAPDDSFGDLGFLARLGFTPVVGEALWRVKTDFAIRDGLEDAFAPGYDVPDEFVEDVRQMTYTSYDDSSAKEDDYSGEKPLDERVAASFVPLLAIFGEEDQIYDARDAVDAYAADVRGARTELIPGAGHSPNVEAPGRTAALILSFAKPVAPVPVEKPKPARPEPTIEKSGGLRGTLLVTPVLAGAGDTLEVRVANRGRVKMLFGLRNRVERRSGDGWADVTKAVFGTPSPQVADLLLQAAAGKVAGPRYGVQVDEVPLPGSLRPGAYRVVKSVAAPSKGGKPAPGLRLDGEFRVRRG
ncbi:MAG TPA: alpha/beta hydrolase [Solirubrobacterales bacterium]|nr:alpha/beta hydrolase [Solirubrobacterales bacterium]